MDVPTSFGDSRLNHGRMLLLLSDPVCALCAVFNGILQPTGSIYWRHFRNVCGPIMLDKYIKFRDPCSNHSREIPPDAVGGGISTVFFAITSNRK